MDIETAVADAPAEISAEPSLAEHEAQFSKSAHQPDEAPHGTDGPPASEGDASPVGERDAQGRFQPRDQRAKSQQARPSDVETIAALTKRLRDAESEAAADIVREDGESERVFQLRRRATIAEALRDAKRAPPTPAAAAAPVSHAGLQPSVPNGGASGHPIELPATFPKRPEQADFNDWEEFLDARSKWNARREFTLARLEQERDTAAREFSTGVQSRYTAATTRYPDFKAVVLDAPTSPIPRGTLLEQWTLEDDAGPDIVYHLFRHPEEVAPMLALTPREQVKTLSLLGQRLTQKPATAPAFTRSAAVAPVVPVVKPPNLVRPGAMRAADEPPGDDAPLSEHERMYSKKRR